MKNKEDVSIEFLLKEFDNTYTEWRRMADSGNAKLQFLFTVIAVTISGISISISNLKPDELAFLFVVASTFLALVGWQTYDYMIIRIISTDINTRAIARIRRYFVENDPKILSYLTWQTDDLPTGFSIHKKRGVTWITQIIFCILVSCLASSIHFFYQRTPGFVVITLISSVMIMYLITNRHITKKVFEYRKLAESDSRFSKLEGPNYEDIVSRLYDKMY